MYTPSYFVLLHVRTVNNTGSAHTHPPQNPRKPEERNCVVSTDELESVHRSPASTGVVRRFGKAEVEGSSPSPGTVDLEYASMTDVSRMIEAAVQRAEADLLSDPDPDPQTEIELPLWDSRIYVDADANIAWRVVHGHKIIVSLVDADLLVEGRARLHVELRISSIGSKPTRVSRGTGSRNLGAIVLDRVCTQPPGTSADHINRDPLDNRRDNLRWSTSSEQAENSLRGLTSRFFGVSLHRASNRFRVTIADKASGKTVAGGYYDSEIEAARAADTLSVQINGPDAKTNLKLGLLPPPDEQLTLPLTEPADAAATTVVD